MRIDAVTVCAGPLYASNLAKALPVWLETCDSVVVVTDNRPRLCEETQANALKGWLAIYQSDVFMRNGGYFNKGAALNEGIVAAKPTDWILAFDCDILPPLDWRKTIEPMLQPGNLYGARRYDQDGKREDRRFEPRGYFQLWHTSDPHYNRSPVFNPTYQDASGYDTEFAAQWPECNWAELPIKLTHLGERSRYWCGPGTTREQQAEAVKRALARRKIRRQDGAHTKTPAATAEGRPS